MNLKIRNMETALKGYIDRSADLEIPPPTEEPINISEMEKQKEEEYQ